MNFSEKLKSKRREFGISQEQLAEKIGVSRQAITKWETDGGMPDVENILAIASLFNVSVDDLLSSEKQLKSRSDFFHNSIVEYDIDSKKHFDINIGGAYKIVLSGNDGEKLRVQLSSNTISSLDQVLKVKIDDGKNNVDVDLHRSNRLSEAQAKEALYVSISLPQKYITEIELAGHTNSLRINDIEAAAVSFDGRVNCVELSGVSSLVELNCSTDITAVCLGLSGGIAFNQLSATSTLHIPKDTEYQVKKKGGSNKVHYTLDGAETEASEYSNTENIIKLSGIDTELVINECTNITEVLQ